jgi:hypothetical protein
VAVNKSKLADRAARRKLDAQIDNAMLRRQELSVQITKMKAERIKRKKQ